ncbi:hypothetical protein [Massilia sp. SYSU DXS3249]
MMSTVRASSALVFATCCATSGCSFITRPMEQPVIEDNLRRNTMRHSDMGILSLSPERRAVLYNFQTRRYCAENPTEVGIDMASAAKLAAGLQGSEARKIAEVAAAASAASNNFVLNRRSQGIILFQSSSYSYCQMFANDAIDGPQFIKLQEAALGAAERVLIEEIRAIATIRDPEPVVPTADEKRAKMEEQTVLPETKAKANATPAGKQPAKEASPPAKAAGVK